MSGEGKGRFDSPQVIGSQDLLVWQGRGHVVCVCVNSWSVMLRSVRDVCADEQQAATRPLLPMPPGYVHRSGVLFAVPFEPIRSS